MQLTNKQSGACFSNANIFTYLTLGFTQEMGVHHLPLPPKSVPQRPLLFTSCILSSCGNFSSSHSLFFHSGIFILMLQSYLGFINILFSFPVIFNLVLAAMVRVNLYNWTVLLDSNFRQATVQQYCHTILQKIHMFESLNAFKVLIVYTYITSNKIHAMFIISNYYSDCFLFSDC